MRYTRLGGTGLEVSKICLGCMSFGSVPRRWMVAETASRLLIKQALEGGINFFDTANMYGLGASEEVTGRALRDFGRRDEVILATKLFYPMRSGPNGGGLSRKAILAAIDGSLARLGTDYVDLYQIHRWDDATPIEETLEALDDLVRSGRVRYLGASSTYAWQLCKALYLSRQHGWSRFVSMQPHYNLLYREEEREMIGLCQAEQVAILPWSPLARGRLARPWEDAPSTARGKIDSYGQGLYAGSAEADRRVVEAVGAVATARGIPRAQISLAWLLSKSSVTAPIVGVTSPRHLEDALSSVTVELSPAEIAALELPYVPHRVAGIE